MKIISCASYYGSGSSVVTDFVSEFNNVYSFTNEEFRFVQDPDGISDLEYNLVENFNRHNSGHALKRFIKLVNFYEGNILNKRYEKYFSGNWHKYSYEYIESLIDFQYHGWWQYDLLDRGSIYYFKKRLVNKLLHLTVWRNNPERTYNSMKNVITYGSHPSEQEFLNKTKLYMDNLFGSVSKGRDTVMVDQIVPPSNLNRYQRYFNDIKVVIVDRDPRDLFILEKYKWRDGVIPTDVETFCKWFNYTREHRKQESLNTENIKFIQFEDMVYHYDKTTNDLIDWLDLDSSNHTKAKEIFNPEVSKKNTQLWTSQDYSKGEIKYIETHLSEYLYRND